MKTSERMTAAERRFFWALAWHVVWLAFVFFGFMHGAAFVLEWTRDAMANG